MISFETETRYYSVTFQADLFGGVTLICQWGGKFNKRKGRKLYCAKTLDEAHAIVKLIKQRRKSHGYQCHNEGT